MSAKYSERKVREALGDIEINDSEIEVYKPPDSAHATNLRPCDFMVWWPDFRADFALTKLEVTGAAWIEVKQNDAVGTFAWSLLRLSQVAAMRRAADIGLPYFVVTYWKVRRTWSITRASRVLSLLSDLTGHPTSATWAELTAIEGIEVASGELASMLRLALLGEV